MVVVQPGCRISLNGGEILCGLLLGTLQAQIPVVAALLGAGAGNLPLIGGDEPEGIDHQIHQRLTGEIPSDEIESSAAAHGPEVDDLVLEAAAAQQVAPMCSIA